MAYGPDAPDQYRQEGRLIAKILKGRKPADLPVERPTKFYFLINLKTAKALGLTIPPSVLGREPTRSSSSACSTNAANGGSIFLGAPRPRGSPCHTPNEGLAQRGKLLRSAVKISKAHGRHVRRQGDPRCPV